MHIEKAPQLPPGDTPPPAAGHLCREPLSGEGQYPSNEHVPRATYSLCPQPTASRLHGLFQQVGEMACAGSAGLKHSTPCNWG